MIKQRRYLVLLALIFCSLVSGYAQRNIFAVVVGVSDYKYDNLKLDLNYCDDDAQLFYTLLTSSGVRSENIVLLKDYNATNQNILSSLNVVFAKASSQDQVIFFFSGHGGEGCFVPYDYDGVSNLVSHSDVKYAFKQCKAAKKLCLADACFSGSIKMKSGKSKSTGNSLNVKSDIVVMMSSRDNQTSQEIPSLQNGAFTHYLVEGLKGNADDNHDKIISVSEMYYYTKNHVMTETHNRQVPIIFGNFDVNMPILYLK